jgi:hypothetical protein
MRRAVIVFFGSCLLLASCTQRMICPAYQSAFIYDKDELRKKFSYFLEDSTPKVYTASKNKYLVAEQVSYPRKLRSMQTVRMKPVPVVVPDSLVNGDSVIMADLDRAARSVIDSTFIVDLPQDSVKAPQDSVYVITKDKELRLLKYNAPDSLVFDSVAQKYIPQTAKYYVKDVRLNIEQDNYMWYLRDNLVLPDVRLAKLHEKEGGPEPGSKEASGKKGKKKGGFFKNLFKKKPKEEIDSTAIKAPPAADEFDYVEESDSTSQAEIPQPKVKEKKGLFGKKKKKNPKPAAPAKKTDPKKEEDDRF